MQPASVHIVHHNTHFLHTRAKAECRKNVRQGRPRTAAAPDARQTPPPAKQSENINQTAHVQADNVNEKVSHTSTVVGNAVASASPQGPVLKQRTGSTPLLDALRGRGSVKMEVPLHIPGHKRGSGASKALTQLMGSEALQHDFTEVPGLDVLSHPTGCIAAAQEAAAATFGAASTWFLVNGTTVGIHAALMATVAQGDTLLLSRNCHISVFSGMVLAGYRPLYMQPVVDPLLGCAHGLTPAAVATALEAAAASGRRVGAVLLVSPTYYGVISNVQDIADIAHAHGVPVIVDEAHGAHLGCHPHIPQGAVRAGADIVVQSTHKVLGSLTQSSMLHLSGNLVQAEQISRALHTLQSSSPSYLLMGSLDAAAAQAADAGSFMVPLGAAQLARQLLENVPGVKVLSKSAIVERCGPAACYDCDPLRLCIVVQEQLGLSGPELLTLLDERYGVVAEMATESILVCAFGVGSTPQHSYRLAAALRDIAEKRRTSSAAFPSALHTSHGGVAATTAGTDTNCGAEATLASATVQGGSTGAPHGQHAQQAAVPQPHNYQGAERGGNEAAPGQAFRAPPAAAAAAAAPSAVAPAQLLWHSRAAATMCDPPVGSALGGGSIMGGNVSGGASTRKGSVHGEQHAIEGDEEVVLTPREAYFAAHLQVPWQEASGRVAAELVSVYPPGIPLVAPGERITDRVLALWQQALVGQRRVTGATDRTLQTMRVVAHQ